MAADLELLRLRRFRETRLTIQEVADYLGYSTRQIQRWEKPETAPYGVTLKPHRPGRRVWYTVADVMECLRQREQRRERMRSEMRGKRRIAV